MFLPTRLRVPPALRRTPTSTGVCVDRASRAARRSAGDHVSACHFAATLDERASSDADDRRRGIADTSVPTGDRCSRSPTS